MACALLYNFICMEMLVDPLEDSLEDLDSDDEESHDVVVLFMECKSSNACRGGPKKGVSTRQTWVHREEKVLMAGLKKIVAQGWKTDNSFKPLYADWIEVFGKDRATGEHASGFVEAVNHTLNKNYLDDAQIFEDLETLNEEKDGQPDKMSASHAPSSASASGEIEQRIGVEYDIANAKKAVYVPVNKVEGLTLHEKLFVADKLVKTTEDVYLIFSLPEAEQAEYICMKLVGTM
ncbi:hypothetical protein BUALT_Bualt13G0072900 [Buddleja alternifolia]|uniref:Uncharacterized protein n=1 Tax=Buddleja alternifolia TaxID=168488 RepID=A0AAV6WWH5_9LAMI|nr:hypothetical protein BUALT_Bualt13G0072900 [Buddleja alternifolia]